MVPSARTVPSVSHLVLAILVAAAGMLSPAVTLAQPAPAPATPSLVVERIETSWLFVPDVRVADLDGRTGGLAGGYVARITDRAIAVGGGGYWLTNRDGDFKLAYGGAVFEWLARTDRTIGFGVRTLIGAGSATLPVSSDRLGGAGRFDPRIGRHVRFGGPAVDPGASFAVRDEFFIAEPQVNLLWNLARQYRLSLGVGYRAVGAAPVLGHQLRGVSGSIALQFGGGS